MFYQEQHEANAGSTDICPPVRGTTVVRPSDLAAVHQFRGSLVLMLAASQ